MLSSVLPPNTDHPDLRAYGDGTARIEGGIRISELKGHGLMTLDGATRVEVTGTVKGSRDTGRLQYLARELLPGSLSLCNREGNAHSTQSLGHACVPGTGIHRKAGKSQPPDRVA